MKRVLFLLLLTPIFLTAQVSINSSHMPINGDTIRYSVAVLDTSVLLNYQNAGANLTWNFDSLVALRQGVSEHKASSQTPYSFFVPNKVGKKIADTLALGPVELYNLYDFSETTSSVYRTTHRGFTLAAFPFPIAQSFQDKDEVYQFPLNFLDRDSSTFKFEFSNALAGAYIINQGYRINQVDAWGTIKTPFGTFSCIRVITDIVSSDSISFSGTNFGLSTHRREYKWLSPQLRIPVLTVSGIVAAGIFVPATVEYRDSVRNVPSIFAPTALFNANPTTYEVNDTVEFNNLSISFKSASYKWNITPNKFQYINNTSATTDSLFVQFTDTGYYDVQLIARNSDGADTLLRKKYIKINEPNSVREIIVNKDFELYPNPLKKGSLAYVKFEDQLAIQAASILDINSKLVENIKLNNKLPLNFVVPNIKSGYYILQLKTEQGIIFKKIMILE
ncbi:MAG: T9SS C-terminal target domain-containing protein [Bacteroidetes bacterium]|nr:MAG: T9SS C-terminal target domain-containing protein [Bacteroidota bacterium]MBL1143530.1 T9SS C-terminal target domain-containing protein [Bacteroidota bacterium]NOG56332.1 T9SS type A sorting domain-containing protein [Bacteroidota bacterium]